jgi:hypothetical protein
VLASTQRDNDLRQNPGTIRFEQDGEIYTVGSVRLPQPGRAYPVMYLTSTLRGTVKAEMHWSRSTDDFALEVQDPDGNFLSASRSDQKETVTLSLPRGTRAAVYMTRFSTENVSAKLVFRFSTGTSAAGDGGIEAPTPTPTVDYSFSVLEMPSPEPALEADIVAAGLPGDGGGFAFDPAGLAREEPEPTPEPTPVPQPTRAAPKPTPKPRAAAALPKGGDASRKRTAAAAKGKAPTPTATPRKRARAATRTPVRTKPPTPRARATPKPAQRSEPATPTAAAPAAATPVPTPGVAPASAAEPEAATVQAPRKGVRISPRGEAAHVALGAQGGDLSGAQSLLLEMPNARLEITVPRGFEVSVTDDQGRSVPLTRGRVFDAWEAIAGTEQSFLSESYSTRPLPSGQYEVQVQGDPAAVRFRGAAGPVGDRQLALKHGARLVVVKRQH